MRMLKLDMHRYKSGQDEYNRECTEDGEYFDGGIFYLNPDNIKYMFKIHLSTKDGIHLDSSKCRSGNEWGVCFHTKQGDILEAHRFEYVDIDSHKQVIQPYKDLFF